VSAATAGGWDASRYHRHLRWANAGRALALTGLVALVFVQHGVARIVWHAVAAVGIGGSIGGELMGYRHRLGLCTACIAAFPLDVQAEVARRRWALRWAHRLMFRPHRVWLVLVVFLAAVAGTSLVPQAEHSAALSAVLAASLVLVTVWSSLLTVHNRFALWCPFCDDGDDGDNEGAPVVPDPAAPGRRG
jgi:hypothetical protein